MNEDPLRDTCIVVDDFRRKPRVLGGYLIYFLSHFHEDHWQGITQTWSYGTIYCSKITRYLLLSKFPLLNDKVIALEMNIPITIHTPDVKNVLGFKEMVVTLIDANHCAGAVMFLFEGKDFGNIIHTGDFRYDCNMKLH